MVMDTKLRENRGRRKNSKQPQRGMGVEQLERLLLEERQAHPVPNVQYRPAMLFQGVMHPLGFGFENSKVLSSIPIYSKCAFNRCGVCHKEKQSISGKTRRSSAQVGEVVSAHHLCSGGSRLKEYEFFPKKGGGSKANCTSVGEMMSANEEESVSSLDLTLKLSY